MKTLITICARGGSKGIPGKNIKLIAGKPLIYYTINVAQKFQEKYSDTEIILSTDSEEIKSVAKQYGLATSYLRPDKLAGDSVGKLDAIRDVLEYSERDRGIKYDYIFDLDVTSPLRNMDDLEKALGIIDSDPLATNLFSVSPANRNPYFNMVEKQENGYYSLVKKRSGDTILARQVAPIVYDMNASFYFYKRSFFESDYKTALTDKTLVYLVPHMCFDLDHPIDFEYMTFLIENNKFDFIL